jgi:choline dehydrogenase-like flavoprotein
LAGRLSEDPEADVILLEAGPDGTAEGSTSANFLAALADPHRLWTESHSRPTPGAPLRPYMRGRGLGGSAAVNGLVGIWFMPDDTVAWSAAGATGWDQPSLSPWRRRVEQSIPLRRAPRQDWSPLEQALALAAEPLGYPWCADPNGPSASSWGVGPAPLTLEAGRRCGPVEAYLAPARPRPNLQVRCGVLVDRVLLAGSRALGVGTADNEEVLADEVILAAGAIASPAILLRSGVWRPGVGRNLTDHASAGYSLALSPSARLTTPDRPVISSLFRYSSGLAGSGPLDMQLLPIAATGLDEAGLATASLQAAVMEGFSRGTVTISSEAPAEPPDVDLRLLSDRRDLVRLRDGLRRVTALLMHEHVKPHLDAVYIDDRGTPLETNAADDAIDAWLSSHTGEYVHAAGTCRMGRADDRLAVVEPSGRLIGHQHLWVADASVLPTVPRANPQLTIMLVAEKIAAHIRHGPAAG